MNNTSTGLKLGGNIPLWKYFLYATIVCFSVCALILIMSILGMLNGSSATVMFIARLWGSSAVLGLFSLFTMNNLFRRESDKQYVRVTSMAAIVMNIIWVLPWLLIVWGVFDKATMSTVEMIARIIANGIISAIILTIFAEYLGYDDYTPAIKVMKYITLGLTAIVGGYTLIQMNTNSILTLGSSFYTLLAVMMVILIFCLIVTPILVKVQKKKLGLDSKVVVVNKLNPEDEAAMKDKIRSEMEAEMRAKIEKEVRAEMGAKDNAAASAESASAPAAPEAASAAPAEEPKKDEYTFSA